MLRKSHDNALSLKIKNSIQIFLWRLEFRQLIPFPLLTIISINYFCAKMLIRECLRWSVTRIILCSLVSVVCDVRCACVRVWAPVKKCLFVCYGSHRSRVVAWGSANTEIDLLEILLYRHIPALKIL